MNGLMQCPLCESHSKLFLANTDREYWHCSVCRLIFVPVKYFISHEEEIEHYLKHENNMESAGYVQMFSDKIEIIQNLCRGVQTVLDYGCGYAPVLKTLLEREGFTVSGYDPHFFPRLEANTTFDLVVSTETFEHFKEPGKELLNIVPRLKPKGYLAVMTRLVPGQGNKENFDDWYYKRDPTHVAFYHNDTFSWIASQYEMEILFNNEKDFVVLQRKP